MSANPRVFFDVSIDGKHSGRLIMELFANVTPKTAEKFSSALHGGEGKREKRKESPF